MMNLLRYENDSTMIQTHLLQKICVGVWLKREAPQDGKHLASLNCAPDMRWAAEPKHG